MCLICNETGSCDDCSYNQGGLARCCKKPAANNLKERMELFTQETDHRFLSASNRLLILLAGEAHDIFAADVFYHQSCYVKFAIKPLRQNKSQLRNYIIDQANHRRAAAKCKTDF